MRPQQHEQKTSYNYAATTNKTFFLSQFESEEEDNDGPNEIIDLYSQLDDF